MSELGLAPATGAMARARAPRPLLAGDAGSSASGRDTSGSLILLATAAVACLAGGCAAPCAGPGTATPVARGSVPLQRVHVRRRVAWAGSVLRGLSGLARDRAGRLWAVAERERLLVGLGSAGAWAAEPEPRLGVRGVPEGWDLEALAWLAPGWLAAGTETHEEGRAEDAVLLLDLDDAEARVTGSLALPYALWGARGGTNRGIEGLCHCDGVLLAGVEATLETAQGRWAPLGRLDLRTRRWEPLRLALTSDTGGLSSLACYPTVKTEEIEVLAVERHYAVSRLLRFVVPRSGPDGLVRPVAAFDLARALVPTPNVEGVVRLGDGGVALLVDNDTGGVTGPTELIVLDLP